MRLLKQSCRYSERQMAHWLSDNPCKEGELNEIIRLVALAIFRQEMQNSF